MSDQRIADLQALLTEATRASDRQTMEIDRLKGRIRELEQAAGGVDAAFTRAVDACWSGDSICGMRDAVMAMLDAIGGKSLTCTCRVVQGNGGTVGRTVSVDCPVCAAGRDPTLEATSLAANWIGMPALALDESVDSLRERVKQWKTAAHDPATGQTTVTPLGYLHDAGTLDIGDPTLEAVARAAFLEAWQTVCRYLGADGESGPEAQDRIADEVHKLADDPAAIAAVVAAGKEGA